MLIGETKTLVVSGILKRFLISTKTGYLLNMALRNLFLSKVLIDEKKSIDVAYSSIKHFIWNMGINLIQVNQPRNRNICLR
jgi:hypothetical protein